MTRTRFDAAFLGLRELGVCCIAFDAGDKDAAIAATVKTLDAMLNQYDVPHTFEIYEGTHTSGVAERVEKKMLPFFSKNLSFGKAGK